MRDTTLTPAASLIYFNRKYNITKDTNTGVRIEGGVKKGAGQIEHPLCLIHMLVMLGFILALLETELAKRGSIDLFIYLFI